MIRCLPPAALALILICASCLGAEGVLRIGLGPGAFTTFDPHRARAPGEAMVVEALFNALLRVKPGASSPAEVEGDLAADWDVSNDGRAWTFYLRRGVLFHGGWGEFSAEDVRYSLERAADPARSAFAAEFSDLEGIDILGRYVARVRFRTAAPGIALLLSNYRGGFIVSRAAGEAMAQTFGVKPIGTGPFVLAGNFAAGSATLLANPAYFRGAPKLPSAAIRYFQTSAALLAAYRAGDVELIPADRDQAFLDAAREVKETRIDRLRPAEHIMLHLNTRSPPLDSSRVREAIAASIDQAALQRALGQETSDIALSLIPAGFLGASDGAPIKRDVARAKRLLAEAGHPRGIALRVVVAQNALPRTILETLREQLRPAGIVLDLEFVDEAQMLRDIGKGRGTLMLSNVTRYPVAGSYLGAFFHSRAATGTGANISHCRAADPELDAAERETDANRQIAFWRAAADKIRMALCAIPLLERPQLWVRTGRLDYGAAPYISRTLTPVISERTTLAPE